MNILSGASLQRTALVIAMFFIVLFSVLYWTGAYKRIAVTSAYFWVGSIGSALTLVLSFLEFRVKGKLNIRGSVKFIGSVFVFFFGFLFGAEDIFTEPLSRAFVLGGFGLWLLSAFVLRSSRHAS